MVTAGGRGLIDCQPMNNRLIIFPKITFGMMLQLAFKSHTQTIANNNNRLVIDYQSIKSIVYNRLQSIIFD